MALDHGEIVSRSLALAGIDDENEILPYCELAEKLISSKLRKGADTADERVTFAVAALAAYKYSLAKSGYSNVASFRAGDVTVTYDSESSLKNAKALFCEALNDISDLILCDDFYFGALC